MAKKKTRATENDAPTITAMKGGLTGNQLLAEVVERMEDDLRISKKQATDFMHSFVAAVEREIQDGKPVNVFGVVKLIPRFHSKGKREVFKEFGNPDSGKVTKKYPAKVSLKATVPKRIKDALPSAAKLGKNVG